MHALTGWIPERIAIRIKDETFNADAVFDRLESGLANGRCLLTVATGEMPDDQAERTGLVPSHAYAVLNLREVDVMLINTKFNTVVMLIHLFSFDIFKGCKTVTIEKSMVPFAMERKLFRIRFIALDTGITRNSELQSEIGRTI